MLVARAVAFAALALALGAPVAPGAHAADYYVKNGGNDGLDGLSLGIVCGKTCAASFAVGTAVTLTAAPEVGFHFVNWTGACTGTAASCTVTVNASATAQANFAK